MLHMTALDCLGWVFTTSIMRSMSTLDSAMSTCFSVICVSLFLSVSSPATLRRSRARLASPCSWAARAAHLDSTPSFILSSLKAIFARLKRMSCSCTAL